MQPSARLMLGSFPPCIFCKLYTIRAEKACRTSLLTSQRPCLPPPTLLPVSAEGGGNEFELSSLKDILESQVEGSQAKGLSHHTLKASGTTPFRQVGPHPQGKWERDKCGFRFCMMSHDS